MSPMTTPTREQVMPEPFGYVSDGFPDGLHFKHKPWPEIHMLINSVSAVYSAAQLLRAIQDAHTAGREQGLREAYDIALRSPFKQPELDAEEWESPEAAHDAGLKSMAFDITSEIRAAIEQLRGKL